MSKRRKERDKRYNNSFKNPQEVGRMSGQSAARNLLIALTFLSVLAAVGCGDYSPVSPSQDNTMPGVENPLFVRLLSTPEGSVIPSDSGDRSIVMGASSKMISAEEGGVVSNGYFSVHFPPGALVEDTEITIEMPEYPSAVVRLSPHGIYFRKEVTLSLPTELIESESAGENYRVLWFNEEVGVWEDMGGYVEDSEVRVELEHFSKYGCDPHG